MKRVLFILVLLFLGILLYELLKPFFPDPDPVEAVVPGGTPGELIIQSTFTPSFLILILCAILLILLAFIIYFRSPNLLLNKLFASAFFAFGLSSLSFSITIFQWLYWTGEQIFIAFVFKLAYTFLFAGLVIVLFAALVLEFGSEATFTLLSLGLTTLITFGNFIILWFMPDSISVFAIPGHIYLSPLVKIVFFGSLAFFYLTTFVIFLKIYQAAEEAKKVSIKWMMMGWMITGIALIFEALREIQFFLIGNNTIGVVMMAFAGIIMQLGFKESEI
ncbi:MAG: hypothetical protein ACFFC7_22710 [Candidatus Hermodarchaeota archaeon]